MTVIAWDGKTLAADKRAVCGGMARTVTKIRRSHNGELVAFSGDFSVGQAMSNWYIEDGAPERYPNNKADGENIKAYLTVIRLDGTFVQYEREPVPLVFSDKKMAQGSGRDYAMAAMHLGCTAVEAVQVACNMDIYCGNGIDTLTLERSNDACN